MSYDRADWHYGGNFPEELPAEAGATHIGMFLAWAIMRGMEGKFHQEECTESLAQVRARQMDGREYLIQECDEKFTSEDLNEEGNAFVEMYYEKYMTDYEAIFGKEYPTLYHVENNWKNFDRMAKILDQRFIEWHNQQK